jgi:hypothetical protein
MGYRVWICTKCKRYMGDQLSDRGLNLGGVLVRNHYLQCKQVSAKDRYVDKYE